VLFAIVIAVSLCMAASPSWWWRLLAGAGAIALAWRPVTAIVFQRGRTAVSRIEWRGDGTWQLMDRGGVQSGAWLAPETCGLGPWLLLVWRTEGESGDHARAARRYALIDASRVSPITFRALRGRLKLSRGREDARHFDDNC
jgi:hypothetical protein